MEQIIIERQTILGEILKIRGIERVEEATERKEPQWNERAFKLLISFVNQNTGPFMAEEVREYAKENGLPKPSSHRAWGGVIRKAMKREIITFVAYNKVVNPKAHRANAAVWRKNDK